jgi:LysR family transcriptional activator of mexEF-oprN operon
MKQPYGRDLDLNLLRVFVVVADEGSVTAAAARLYLTQPALSAALKRLATALGAPLFARQGRGLVLTDRGRRLLALARPLLDGVVDAALSPPRFDPQTSQRTFRLGLSGAGEMWLLPPLLRTLAREAPGLSLIVLPVQFRTVGEALSRGRLDAAVTTADELPRGVLRRDLFTGSFVCLYDPRQTTLPKRPSLERYLAHEHVVVSYNGDVRGVVEDAIGVVRDVRVSVASFHAVAGVVDGSALLATVPAVVAGEIKRLHPKLKTASLPFPLAGSPVELLWPAATDGDEAAAFLRGHIEAIARRAPPRGRRGGGSFRTQTKARPAMSAGRENSRDVTR